MLGPNWPRFRTLWRSQAAYVILSTAPTVHLATIPGPLRNLIAATCDILSNEALAQIDDISAQAAIQSSAVETLATVLNWIQLNPCHALHSATTASGLNKLFWYRLLKALHLVTRRVIASPVVSSLGILRYRCGYQLQRPGGERGKEEGTSYMLIYLICQSSTILLLYLSCSCACSICLSLMWIGGSVNQL